MIDKLQQFAEDCGAVERPKPIESFRPFPVSALPEPVRGFIEAGAAAIGCDESYIGLPILVAMAAAIGNTRALRLKRRWEAPSILWGAIVGESGTAKSPAFRLALRPIRERQRAALELHAEELQGYDDDLAIHEKQLAAWKRDHETDDPPPARPQSPHAARYIVSDTTIEALAPILKENPRGLLLERDELAAWFGSFAKYSSGSDAPAWLSMHGGDAVTVDRKTGNPKTIYIPHALVSVIGGIQPGILHRALGAEHRESGLAARLLLTYPPRKAKQWTDAEINPEIERAVDRLFDGLYNLKPETDDEGDGRPVMLELSPEAKTIWTAYYNSHAKEQTELDGELSAAWSKLEEGAARLALVIHCARVAAGDPSLADPARVDAESMTSGVTLAEWFKREARRVYALLSETAEESANRKLVEWIERRGGEVTARDLQRGKNMPNATMAEAGLDSLKKAGLGEWIEREPGSQGGRPTRVFRLLTQ